MISLRPYQSQVVSGVAMSYRKGSRATCLVVPTGGGKTIVFAYWTWSAVKAGKRVLILAHREELIKQICRALQSFGLNSFGVHMSKGGKPSGAELVQVGMYLTVSGRVERIVPPDYIIIDETHHALAKTWRELLSCWPDAKVLGVTATPCRGDGAGLGRDAGGIFDEMVIGPSFMDLMRMGNLARPVHLRPKRSIDFSSVPIEKGEFQTKAMSKVMNSNTITGDAIELYRKHIDGFRMIVFCVDVEHSIKVSQMFNSAGIASDVIYGDKKRISDDEREAIVRRFQLAETKVLVNCDILGEGFDLEENLYPESPPLMAVCLLSKTNSLSRYLQRVGRGSRPVAGRKDHFYIFDQVDNFLIHGGCWWDRDWNLAGETKEAKKATAAKAEKMQRCEQCDACYDPQPACPECGHVKARKDGWSYVDGEMFEVTPEMDQTAQTVAKAKAEKAAQREAALALKLAKREEKAKNEAAKSAAVDALKPRFVGKVGFELRAEIEAVTEKAKTLKDLHVAFEAAGLEGKTKNGFVIRRAIELGIDVPFIPKKK